MPVEVKAEINLKAKSLKTYCEKFTPQISIRTAMTDFKKERDLINLPLYAVGELAGIISKQVFIEPSNSLSRKNT